MRSDDFRRMWATHDVTQYRSGTQYFHHERVGDLDLDYESFDLAGDIVPRPSSSTPPHPAPRTPSSRRSPRSADGGHASRPTTVVTRRTGEQLMCPRVRHRLTTGLGLATAAALLDDGHSVIVHARNPSAPPTSTISSQRGADLVVGDLSIRADVVRVADQVNSLGPLDAVVHNAGVYIDRNGSRRSTGMPKCWPSTCSRRTC